MKTMTIWGEEDLVVTFSASVQLECTSVCAFVHQTVRSRLVANPCKVNFTSKEKPAAVKVPPQRVDNAAWKEAWALSKPTPQVFLTCDPD